jgi:putative membrane protein
MSWIIGILVTMIVVALGLLIISKIPAIGVEVDSMGIALTAAVVFGVLNGLLGWVGGIAKATVILSPISWLMNIAIFGLAAWLVEGFRLRNGILSAILGALGLSLIFSLARFLLPQVGIPMPS